jgi:biotin carboxylase
MQHSREPRVLLLIPMTTYRAEPFLAAAERLGVEVVIGSNYCHVLAGHYSTTGSLVMRFDEPAEALATILAAARERPFAAVLAVDDMATEIAASAASALGLAHNSPRAASRARHKGEMRAALHAHQVQAPQHRVFPRSEPPVRAARAARDSPGFPCVLKPLLLSGSRGVIRADDEATFIAAWARIAAILDGPDLRGPAGHDPAMHAILVERYIPGREVALEALLRRGRLTPLALFDKPDPLAGPFFEETIYVTPSRLPEEQQTKIIDTAAAAAAAIGLTEGPVHAELRIDDQGVPWVVEVAGRSIGGLCSRALRFGLGDISLEELILRQALGREIDTMLARADVAAGVMMLPIPRAGVLREVRGEEAARAVAGVTDLEITIRRGEEVTPLPEGARYLGFLFARGAGPGSVERALRAAAERLSFDIGPSGTLALARNPDSDPTSDPIDPDLDPAMVSDSASDQPASQPPLERIN